MPVVNGLDLAAAILAERPEQDVILFSAYLDEEALLRAERLGVRDCVSKDRVRDIPGHRQVALRRLTIRRQPRPRGRRARQPPARALPMRSPCRGSCPRPGAGRRAT